MPAHPDFKNFTNGQRHFFKFQNLSWRLSWGEELVVLHFGRWIEEEKCLKSGSEVRSGLGKGFRCLRDGCVSVLVFSWYCVVLSFCTLFDGFAIIFHFFRLWKVDYALFIYFSWGLDCFWLTWVYFNSMFFFGLPRRRWWWHQWPPSCGHGPGVNHPPRHSVGLCLLTQSFLGFG